MEGKIRAGIRDLVILLVAMAAGNRRPPAATLPAVLILVCVLVASASGLQMLPDEDPSTYPEDSSRPREFWYPRGEVIVIDLGNTNSCVAGYTGSGKTTDDDDTMFQFCIPSWVAFTDNGTALVGEAAKNHAAADPEATIFGFKRLLGLRYIVLLKKYIFKLRPRLLLYPKLF